MMLKAIDRRLHNQFAMEAGLHGFKIPLRYNRDAVPQEDVDFDPVVAEKAMIEAQKRVKARYG
jgi:hypothetical protein